MTPTTLLSQYLWLEKELTALYGAVKYSSHIGLKLERIEQLLGLIGDPHLAFRSLHIGGTSGKGSTAVMAANILEGAGYRVGLHTSPHLQIMNERHRINGRYVATSQLIEAWQTLKPAVEEVTRTSLFGSPSYFEAQVALSFLLFRQAGVEIAVVEVGLGGSIDATNILPAEVAVLTNVGLDHTDILGTTVEEIARDKLGIFKKNQRVVSGCWQPEIQAMVRQRAQMKGARLWQIGVDFRVEAAGPGRCHLYLPGRNLREVKLGLEGFFQAQNAALAVAAVLSLRETPVPDEAIRAGLAGTHFAGRVERVQERPLVLLDGAHNPDKVRASLSVLEDAAHKAGRIITVLGLKQGKDAAEIVPPVVQHSDLLILTAFADKGLWKGMDPYQIAQLVTDSDPTRPLLVRPQAAEAVAEALRQAGPNDIVWITGSLYLVGEVRERWFPTADLLAALEPKAARPQELTS